MADTERDLMRALTDARDLAMKNVIAARIPESGDFGAIAQNLDWVLEQLSKALASRPAEVDDEGPHFYTFTRPEGWINLLNPAQSWQQWTATQGLPTTRGWKVFGAALSHTANKEK